VIRRPSFPALVGLVLLFCVALAVAPLRAAPYAAMVMDARTGEVLHSRNADTRLHPASLTKMMTLYIAFEAVRLGEITMDTRVTISRAAANEPYALGFRAGSQVRLRFLVRAAAVRSANDAATAIAEAIEGSEAAFARRMNRTARALGMTRTTFRNAHGLTEDGHMSTARDMTIMGRRIFYDYPQYYNIFSRRQTDAGSIGTVRNTNRAVLNGYRGADGIKTGYTRAAGFNLVASAERGQERIIATVFGGRSAAWRNQRIMELFDMGFSRAPSSATVRRPALPTYGDQPSGPIRNASGAVASSLRPQPRPGPIREPEPALVAAIEDAVGDAITNLEEGAETTEASGVETETQLAGVVPQPRPISVEPASAPDAADQPAEVDPITAIAEAAISDAEADPQIQVEVAETAEAEPQTEPETVEVAAAAPTQAPTPRPARPAAPEQTASLVVPPRPADIPVAAAPEPEVVTRASSSGSRLYGVSLGAQPSHHAAERLLLRTALSEVGTFDEALRRVVRGSRGFEARFQGMTQDQAARACARLNARNVVCEPFGPAS